MDCFNRTIWDIFEHPDLEVFTDSVLCYIKSCIDTVTVDRLIQVYPNQKPWMTREVWRLLKERNTAFRSSDRALYSTACTNLKRGILMAKSDYTRRIEEHLDSNNSRQVWQGVQHITNSRTYSAAADGDASLAEALNIYFARFEEVSTEAVVSHPAAQNSPILTVEEGEVRRTLKAVNPRKAAGPDGVPGHVLKECADQLGEVFTRIFKQSLSQSTVPPCLKSSTIVPLPKKTNVTSLSDYRPVALTPVVMKCLKKWFGATSHHSFLQPLTHTSSHTWLTSPLRMP